MAASEAAVTAVMEALDCKREVDRNGHAYCEAHWFGWLSDVDACPRAERAANAAVDADRASIQAETLREAAGVFDRLGGMLTCVDIAFRLRDLADRFNGRSLL